jgi:hypothetical protein
MVAVTWQVPVPLFAVNRAPLTEQAPPTTL